MLGDLREFARAFWNIWIGLMCGVVGLIWTMLSVWFPQTPPWIYFTLCGVALFFAAFIVWRQEFRKVKQYEVTHIKIDPVPKHSGAAGEFAS